MARNLPHLLLESLNGEAKPYKSRRGFGSGGPAPYLDRIAHANELLKALSHLPDINKENLPGLYLRVDGRPNEPMITDSLGKSGLTLLQVKEAGEEQEFKQAIVFASSEGINRFERKICAYRDSAYKYAPLVDSVASLAQATLQDLWKSKEPLPNDVPDAVWEIWVRRESWRDFSATIHKLSLQLVGEQLDFPDDIVVIGKGNYSSLSNLVKQSGAVRWLVPVATPAFFLDNLPTTQEQKEWGADLLERLKFGSVNTGYATILDYGIGLSNPLIQPALDSADRYAAEPSWGMDTVKPHGTAMAGLAIYGDLIYPLLGKADIIVNHRLESIKILPEVGRNPQYLFGKVMINGIYAAETCNPDRRRTFIMAVTASDDTPHDGAPTAWSAAVDQCAAGTERIYGASANDRKQPRLILVSAGNVDWDKHKSTGRPYLDVCDAAEIESPAQAWNAITVGAYTEKTRGSPHDVAESGDLSPASRTASWDKYWPIKPDIVMEGGNYTNAMGWPPCPHEDVCLLTTNHNYPRQSLFLPFWDTSAATALAGKAITELWNEYPDFWPETIRGLFIASARWTPQMEKRWRLAGKNMRDWKRFSKRYGYGVPELNRAKWSAKNALTMIIQDTITPYSTEYKNGSYGYNGLKLYKLPWPESALRAIATKDIKVRVALSYFIDPNPSQPETSNKYTYASYALRFDLRRVDETQEQFALRVGNDKERDNNLDGRIDWQFGSQQRDVGSIQVDWIEGKASDFIQRDCLAVYPIGGWRKIKQSGGPRETRFSVIIEIDAENANDVDIYMEVKNQISVPVTV